jgi:hypothetical protein
MALFRAADSCFAAGDHPFATFLLVAGQIRASTDMAILRPVSDVDRDAASSLYGFVFYQAGGAGPDSLYRDPAALDVLLDRIQGWSVVLSEGYDPGWKYKRSKRNDFYAEVFRESKEARLAQLRRYGALLRNEAYYTAHAQFAELMRLHRGTFTQGTPAWAESERLQRLMASAAREIAPVAEPKPARSRRYLHEPDEDAGFRQLAVGFNGHGTPASEVFGSESEVRSSWLARALGPDTVSRLLSRIDFTTEMLVVASLGQGSGVTDVLLSDVHYSEPTQSLTVSAGVAVNDSDCRHAHAPSYPFVVGSAPRPVPLPGQPGYSFSSFADGCKVPKTGTRTPRL